MNPNQARFTLIEHTPTVAVIRHVFDADQFIPTGDLIMLVDHLCDEQLDYTLIDNVLGPIMFRPAYDTNWRIAILKDFNP